MKRLLNKSSPLGKHFFSFFLTPHFARPKPGATIPGDSRRMTILPRRSRVKASALSRTACDPGQPQRAPPVPRQNILSIFSLKCFAFQTIRPVVSRKTILPACPGRADSPPPAFSLFQRQNALNKKNVRNLHCERFLSCGAEGETRTPTPLRELDPEPSVSTNSTTSA